MNKFPDLWCEIYPQGYIAVPLLHVPLDHLANHSPWNTEQASEPIQLYTGIPPLGLHIFSLVHIDF